VAVLAADLDEHDCETDYVSDVFTGPRKEGYNHSIAVGYARFARDLAAMSEPEIAQKYNMELSRSARLLPNAGETARQFIEMYQRHAQAVCGVLDQQIKLHSREFVAGTVDPTSLLGIVVQSDDEDAVVETATEARQKAHDAVREQDTAQANVFRRDGEKWTVTFDGVTKHFSDTKGMHYLRLLLAHPNREFGAMELVNLVDGQPAPDRSLQTTPRALEDSGLVQSDLTDAGEIMDPEYRRHVQQRLGEINEEIQRASLREDLKEEERLEEEKEKILQIAASALGLGGGSRKADDPPEKARKLAQRHVQRTRGKMEKEHPALHDHLKKAVRTGYTLAYSPDRSIDWVTD
jgi:hypothetical protein